MRYLLADRDGNTIKNTYSGMTDEDITAVLTGIGCTNIRFVTADEWARETL